MAVRSSLAWVTCDSFGHVILLKQVAGFSGGSEIIRALQMCEKILALNCLRFISKNIISIQFSIHSQVKQRFPCEVFRSA